jgi:hypothetical protein
MKRRFRSAVVGLVLLGSASGCDSTTPLAPTRLPVAAPTGSVVPPTPNANAIAIAGYVQDRAWRPLIGVRVEVLDGPDAGLSTVTDAKGEFRLAGEFDPTTRFRASAEQHRDMVRVLPPRCDRCNPNWWLYFSLETEAASVDLAGEYSLTFIADRACTMLPEEFRQRTYPATVTPTGSDNAGQFKVSVRGGSFLTGYDAFDVGVAGDSFAAILGDLHGSPGVAERLDGANVLGFEGMANASLASPDTAIVATFDGVVSYCNLLDESAARYACASSAATARALCTSRNHLLLSRATSASQSR